MRLGYIRQFLGRVKWIGANVDIRPVGILVEIAMKGCISKGMAINDNCPGMFFKLVFNSLFQLSVMGPVIISKDLIF